MKTSPIACALLLTRLTCDSLQLEPQLAFADDASRPA